MNRNVRYLWEGSHWRNPSITYLYLRSIVFLERPAFGGLCCLCHIRHGITYKCMEEGCTTSFHPLCLWYYGGYLSIHPKKIYKYVYQGGGKNMGIDIYCSKHCPVCQWVEEMMNHRIDLPSLMKTNCCYGTSIVWATDRSGRISNSANWMMKYISLHRVEIISTSTPLTSVLVVASPLKLPQWTMVIRTWLPARRPPSKESSWKNLHLNPWSTAGISWNALVVRIPSIPLVWACPMLRIHVYGLNGL